MKIAGWAFGLSLVVFILCPGRVRAGEDNPFNQPPKGPDSPFTTPPAQPDSKVVDDEDHDAGKKKAAPAENKADKDKNDPPKAVQPPPKPKVCPLCMGTGFVPCNAKPYVHFASDPLAQPADALPWKYCPKCQAGKEAKELEDLEAARLPKLQAQHQIWEQRLGLKFNTFETHHVTVHSQVSQEQNRAVADRLEQLSALLMKLTKVTVLTQCRPDQHEILIFSGKDEYLKYVDLVAKNAKGKDAENEIAVLRQCTGSFGVNYSVFYFRPEGPPEDNAVFFLAKMMMMDGLGIKKGNEPAWLIEGFASYCENAILGKNLCHTIAYEVNPIKLGMNWNVDVAKLAKANQLKRWDLVFLQGLIGLKAPEYVTSYSIVSFLIQSSPQKFVQLVLNMRDGMDSQKALEKAYSTTLVALEAAWMNYCLSLK